MSSKTQNQPSPAKPAGPPPVKTSSETRSKP